MIYTLGYEKRSIDEYISVLKEMNINILIDVREFAWSYKKGFSKTQFKSHLSDANITYIHIPEAGNPKRIRTSAKSVQSCLKKYKLFLKETESGIKELNAVIDTAKKNKHKVCLTCFEREHTSCHRSIITDHLLMSRKKLNVFHL